MCFLAPPAPCTCAARIRRRRRLLVGRVLGSWGLGAPSTCPTSNGRRHAPARPAIPIDGDCWSGGCPRTCPTSNRHRWRLRVGRGKVCVGKIVFGNEEKKLRWGLSTRVLNFVGGINKLYYWSVFLGGVLKSQIHPERLTHSPTEVKKTYN